jgi:hypothetical protein
MAMMLQAALEKGMHPIEGTDGDYDAWLGSSFHGAEHSARGVSDPHNFLKSRI